MAATKYRQDMAWWGLGVKGGGTFAVGGLELLEAAVVNAGTPTAKGEFHILNWKLGVGLGGSVGLCAVFIFNCNNLWVSNGEMVDDWGVNVSLGEKWSDFVKGLKAFSLFSRAAKLGSKLKGVTPGDIDDARNLLHYIWNGYDIGSGGSGFKLVTLDIPGSGLGYEVSAAITRGKFEVLS